jgi:hypothetical protein
MNVTVRDASLVTKRNRNKAEYSYYESWKDATVLSAHPSPATTAPTGAGAQVVSEIKLGCEACTIYNNSRIFPNPDPNHVLYPFNPSAGGFSKFGPS